MCSIVYGDPLSLSRLISCRKYSDSDEEDDQKNKGKSYYEEQDEIRQRWVIESLKLLLFPSGSSILLLAIDRLIDIIFAFPSECLYQVCKIKSYGCVLGRLQHMSLGENMIYGVCEVMNCKCKVHLRRWLRHTNQSKCLQTVSWTITVILTERYSGFSGRSKESKQRVENSL